VKIKMLPSVGVPDPEAADIMLPLIADRLIELARQKHSADQISQTNEVREDEACDSGDVR
jgi:hypothetical protein